MDWTREIGDDENQVEEENSGDGPDLRPEYCHYRDEGCEYAEACLECPFQECLFDEPWGRQRWLKGMRNREIKRLFAAGWNAKELAMLFGVSQRTIQRAVKSESVSTIGNSDNHDNDEEGEDR